MHEATIRWIGSFLTDRSQRVRIGQVYSHPVTPNEGIPQGTDVVHGRGGVPPSLSVGWHRRTLVFAWRMVFAFVILIGRRLVSACCW